MQFFILLVGVMVFVFYQFNTSPVFFNSKTLEKLKNSDAAPSVAMLEMKKDSVFLIKKSLLEKYNLSQANPEDKKALQLQIQSLETTEKDIRNEAKNLVKTHLPEEESNDKDYVFISFILAHLPKGIIGLLLAVIFSAAMSSTASELNALATTTSVDIYKRLVNPAGNEMHYVLSSKWLTVIWGGIAIGFACFGTLFENLIQFVNIIGSVFYGTILGIFMVAFYFRTIKANAVFYAALIAEAIVLLIFWSDIIGYLWLNVIGCVLVISIGWLFENILMKPKYADVSA